MSNLRKTRKIQIYTPTELHNISRRVKELDTRIRLTDADIVACAIEDNADNLITLDRNLLGNKGIVAEFGLRITHPKDLL